jgi:hypothetical protein
MCFHNQRALPFFISSISLPGNDYSIKIKSKAGDVNKTRKLAETVLASSFFVFDLLFCRLFPTVMLFPLDACVQQRGKSVKAMLSVFANF